MSQEKAKISFDNLGAALDRFDDVLKVELEQKDYVLDAAIQRFEFVIELYWKTFKNILEWQGKSTSLPKESLQEAYQAGWIHDEKLWLAMMQDRNLTSHTYQHQTALKIYHHLHQYYPEMRAVYEQLKSRFFSE